MNQYNLFLEIISATTLEPMLNLAAKVTDFHCHFINYKTVETFTFPISATINIFDASIEYLCWYEVIFSKPVSKLKISLVVNNLKTDGFFFCHL